MSDTRFIHGFHAINARLRQSAGSVQEIYLAAGRQDGRTRDLIRLAEAQGVRVIATDPARLDGMAGSHGKAGLVVDAAYVDARLKDLSQSEDLARYVL